MRTRSIADFRSDYNIWRKDLAEELNIRESELERLEFTGEVPLEIAEVLSQKYNLPEDYFTEDADRAAVLAAAAERYEPKRPFLYFFKESFLWSLLLGLVFVVVQIPLWISANFNSSFTTYFNTIQLVCSGVILIVSGIYLGSHILKKTNFRGSISDFEFLFPYLPAIAASGFLKALSELFHIEFISVSGVQFLLLLFPALGFIVFLTFLLDAAARADGKAKTKRLLILCAVALGLQLFAYIAQMINGTFFGVSATVWIERALSLALFLLIAYGTVFDVQKHPKLKVLWLTVLPITAMVLTVVFSILQA